MTLPRVHRVTGRDGRVRKYHRATRAKLPDLPEDHPDFIAAWLTQEGERPRQPVTGKPGSIAAAVAALLASGRYLGASEAYRRVIHRHADSIREAYGHVAIAGLQAKHIRADLTKLPPNPANARLKAWRMLCAVAVEVSLISASPTDGIKRQPPPKTDGHLPWTRDHIDAFRAYWPIGSDQRLAFEILYWTGARISDAVRLSEGMVASDGILTFTQSKTKGKANVPWTCPVPDYADPQDRDLMHMALNARTDRSLVLITTQFGKPRSIKAFGGWLAGAARKAGVDRTAHGLRKNRLAALAEAGAPAMAIMSWGGHASLEEVQHYIDSADKRRILIGQPVHKLDQPVHNHGKILI